MTKTLLIVEDMPSVALWLSHAISPLVTPMGLTPIICPDLVSAHERVSQHGLPACALIDQNLPDGLGDSLIECWGPKVPVLLISADQPGRPDWSHARVRAFQKPVGAKQLLRCVQSLLTPCEQVPPVLAEAAEGQGSPVDSVAPDESFQAARAEARTAFMRHIAYVAQSIDQGHQPVTRSLLHRLRGSAAIHSMSKLAGQLSMLEHRFKDPKDAPNYAPSGAPKDQLMHMLMAQLVKG